MKKYFESPLVRKVTYIVGAVAVILVIFEAGDFFGYHRAAYHFRWNDSVYSGLRDPRSALAPFMRGQDEHNPNGAVGEIISLDLPRIFIKGPQSPEQIITMDAKTSIRFVRGTASTSDLLPGKQIIVIGSPDESGALRASFIRILPPPRTSTSSNPQNQ